MVMKFVRWVERKLWLGEVLHEYDTVESFASGGVKLRTTLFLVRRADQLAVAVRTSRWSFLGGGVSCAHMLLTPETLATLKQVVKDVEPRFADEQTAGSV